MGAWFSHRADKERLVKQILDNRTYHEDSGVHQNLKIALMRLSKSDLGNLLTILELKLRDARAEQRIVQEGARSAEAPAHRGGSQ